MSEVADEPIVQSESEEIDLSISEPAFELVSEFSDEPVQMDAKAVAKFNVIPHSFNKGPVFFQLFTFTDILSGLLLFFVFFDVGCFLKIDNV